MGKCIKCGKSTDRMVQNNSTDMPLTGWCHLECEIRITNNSLYGQIKRLERLRRDPQDMLIMIDETKTRIDRRNKYYMDLIKELMNNE